MPICANPKCKLPFEWTPNDSNRPQKYCKRPECTKERRRAQNEKSNKQYKALTKKHGLKRPTKKCKYCVTYTNNHFGICDRCRNRIIQEYDMKYIQSIW